VNISISDRYATNITGLNANEITHFRVNRSGISHSCLSSPNVLINTITGENAIIIRNTHTLITFIINNNNRAAVYMNITRKFIHHFINNDHRSSFFMSPNTVKSWNLNIDNPKNSNGPLTVFVFGVLKSYSSFNNSSLSLVLHVIYVTSGLLPHSFVFSLSKILVVLNVPAASIMVCCIHLFDSINCAGNDHIADVAIIDISINAPIKNRLICTNTHAINKFTILVFIIVHAVSFDIIDLMI
jgi:hypothetical protein